MTLGKHSKHWGSGVGLYSAQHLVLTTRLGPDSCMGGGSCWWASSLFVINTWMSFFYIFEWLTTMYSHFIDKGKRVEIRKQWNSRAESPQLPILDSERDGEIRLLSRPCSAWLGLFWGVHCSLCVCFIWRRQQQFSVCLRQRKSPPWLFLTTWSLMMLQRWAQLISPTEMDQDLAFCGIFLFGSQMLTLFSVSE